MSQITCCPECHTRFKVVDDQLRIAGGWVRCGKCKAVFDAPAHMRRKPRAQGTEPADTAADGAGADASAVLVTENSVAIDPGAAMPELSVLVFPRRAAPGDPLYVDPSWKDSYLEPRPVLKRAWDAAHEPAGPRIGPAPFTAPDEMQELQARAEKLLSASALQREPEAVPQPQPAPAHSRLPRWSASEDQALDSAMPGGAMLDGGMAAAAPSTHEPRFVREARRRAFWRRPAVVASALLAMVVLALALLAQWGIQHRDALAARYPAARAMLDPWCAWAGCRIAPVREIDRVLIDSTSFRKLAPQRFELSVVLRNQAAYEVAVPALELTLNDAAEKLLLRKVLQPAELGAPAALPANGEWTARAVVQVAEGGAEAAGYRVLAFYP